MRGAAAPSLPPDTRAPAPTAPSPALPLVLLAVLVGAVAAGAALAYGATSTDLRRQRLRELGSVAALKVEEIERWRDERLADATFVAVTPLIGGAAGSSPPGGASRAALVAWLDRLRDLGDYSDASTLLPGGEVGVTSGSQAQGLADAGLDETLRRAVREGRPVLSGVHRLGITGPLHLDLVAPVPEHDGRAGGAVLLRIDPYRYLFRLVQSWPAPSSTAETLLVWRDGDRVRFANELRHWTDDPLALSVPIDRRDDPAVRAATGETGTAEGIDYRGRRVLAAMLPVAGTPWALVAKMDEDEAMAPLRVRALSIVLAAVALVMASASGAALWWRRQRTSFDRQRYRAEVERDALLAKVEWLTRYGSDMVILADERLVIVEANDRAAQTLGWSPAELVGMDARQLRDPATLGDFEDWVREQRAAGLALYETRYRRKDGSTFPVELSVRTLDIDGRPHHHAIVRDITERKRVEAALRASEEKFRAAFEQAALGIALMDVHGRLAETNLAFRRILGSEGEDPRGRTVVDLMEPGEAAAVQESIRMLLAGEQASVEVPRRFRRSGGGSVETVVRARPIRGLAGEILYVLAVVEDLSERRRLEAQLMLADRMASVGTLAAGVAHEINNPLAYIVANLDWALEQLRGSGAAPGVVKALEEANEGGARVREIVRDLKTFSRPSGGERGAVDVCGVIRSAASLAQNEIRHRARLELALREVPPVVGNEYRLGQVVLNLLINAAQAIEEGRVEANLVRVATRTSASGAVEIEVSDTGAGIPPEIRDRIFDPFFTTKPVGVGTGLGLAICHGIVSDLGGGIRVASEVGRGTTFTVTLPPASAHAAQGTARFPGTRAPAAAPGSGRRILVVDDELFVGRAVERILSPPHDVAVETSARAALARVEGGDRAFDVVLCDLMMPEMTGMELHAKVAALSPDLAARFVFLTGGAFTGTARDFLERVPNPRMEKPVGAADLRRTVERLLAAR